MKNTPKHLTKLLWEYDIEKLEKEDPIVLERTLSFGNMEDIRYIGISNLREYFQKEKPLLDPKSYNFWSVISDTPRSSSPPTSYDLIHHPISLRSFR